MKSSEEPLIRRKWSTRCLWICVLYLFAEPFWLSSAEVLASEGTAPATVEAEMGVVEVTEEKISLPVLLKRAEANSVVQSGLEAVLKSARAKLNQVHMEKWLNTFELTAYGGVVPDVRADNAVRNQDAQALLFGADSGELDDDFSLSRLGPFARMELKAVQPIYTFGKIASFEEMAKKGVRIAEIEREKQIAELRLMVKRAYYTLQLSEESLKVLEEVRGKLKHAEEKVEELLIKGGKNSENVEETDRLKIKVFQADVENRALDAYRGRKAAIAALFELCGAAGNWRPDQDNLQAEFVEGVEKDGIISLAMRSRPEIKQIDEYVKVKIAERGTIRANLFPTVFVAGEVNYAVAPDRTDIDSPFLSDDFNKFNAGVALGLKQDLGFHRSLNKMKILDAEIQALRAQKERLAVLSRLKVDEAFEKAVAAQQAIQFNENGFRAARSWLTSAGLAFNLGTAPTKDVLESYAAYFKARVDLLRSIYELNIALSELSQVAGTELVGRLK